MKHLLGLLFIFVSFASHAELTVSEQDIMAKLKSGEIWQIKTAAKNIHTKKIDNIEVLDYATEMLLQIYPDAEKKHIDTLSWLAKVIGNSENGRYHQALTEVSQYAPHRDLRAKAAEHVLKLKNSQELAQYTKGSITEVMTMK